MRFVLRRERKVVHDVAIPARELPGVELVDHGGTPGRPGRFTTWELLAVDRDALELALAVRDANAPRPDEKTLLRALVRAETLTNEQRDLVREASLSP